ncbi:MAG: DUF362 domain-containing protein [Candidatus Omnitrophota bacterium]|nr:DUF362 domain-containing protein [Candidatus Omnitrophota bacterium]
MKKVVILKIDSYDVDVIKDKVKKAIYEHFSFDSLFSPGDKILLKPNLLMPSNPDEAIITHPVVVSAVSKIFKEAGFEVCLGDAPGVFCGNKDLDSVYDATGIKKIAQSEGIQLLYPKESVVCSDIPLCWWACPDDLRRGDSKEEKFKMINMPKLKTHEIMVLTLAVKNLYGCISGLYKSRLHCLYPTTEKFSDVIVKLYKMIKPSLNIVDGIVALEGQGPAKKGTPRKVGIIVIGDDALYVDYVIGNFLNLAPGLNPLIKKARQLGLIKEEELEVISEIGDTKVSDFKFPNTFILNRVPPFVLVVLKLLLKFKPAVNYKKCKNCRMCEKVCPAAAISMDTGKVVIEYKKCIMCMCCSEMCPFGAIDVKKSFLLRLSDMLHKKRHPVDQDALIPTIKK